MENRLKERLTGAAILVALIVLIVPEIFRGQSAPPGVAHAPAAQQGAPARSFTIDLNAAATQAPSPRTGPAPAASAPPASVPAALAPAALPPAASAPAASHAADASQETPVPAPPAAAAIRAPVARGSSLGHNAATRHAAASRHVGTTAGSAAASRHVATTAHSAASGAAGWSVQLGLFSKAENAARLARTAHGKGFAVRVSRSPHGLYRVALAGLDHAQALRASRRLHAAGLPAAVQGPR